MAHQFNNTRQLEAYIFEHVYLDIWRPVPVQLAGGAIYFMALITLLHNLDHLFSLTIMICLDIRKTIYLWIVVQLKIVITIIPSL